jgi:hypothetical protein
MTLSQSAGRNRTAYVNKVGDKGPKELPSKTTPVPPENKSEVDKLSFYLCNAFAAAPPATKGTSGNLKLISGVTVFKFHDNSVGRALRRKP